MIRIAVESWKFGGAMGKVSVIMTTYNGEDYILPQLQSLFGQKRKPDEVIICDDCSEDRTRKLVEDFISSNKLKNWTLYKNEERLGYIGNYRKAMALATGDIVFLCDQDDIWCENKIADMARIMEGDFRIKALACGYCVIDSCGKPLEPQPPKFYTVRTIQTDPTRVRGAGVLYRNVAQGCAGAYRRSLVKQYIESEGGAQMAHDWALNMLAHEQNGLFFLNRELLLYRLHENNATGIAVQSRVDTLTRDLCALESSKNLPLSSNSMRELEEIVRFYRVRIRWLSEKRMLIWLAGLVRFFPLIIRYFWKQYLKDFVSI